MMTSLASFEIPNDQSAQSQVVRRKLWGFSLVGCLLAPRLSALVALGFIVASSPFAELRADPTQAAQPSKLICCHIMHQMSIGAEAKPNESVLSATPSTPGGLLGMDIPAYLPNYRRPLPAARQDIAVAQAAGINTFDMCMSPNHFPKSQYTSIIRAYWQAASETPDFKMAIDIWFYPDRVHSVDVQVQKMGTAMGILRHDYDSAWRRVSGKYLVVLQTDYRYEPGDRPLTLADLDTMFAPLGGRKAVYLVQYDPVNLRKTNLPLFNDADAFSDWPSRDYGHAEPMVDGGQACAKAAGKPYWCPAMPSFTQSRLQLSSSNVREKLGIVNFLADWNRAIKADAPAVDLITWNDLSEESTIMPDTNHGYAYHELTRLYTARLITGSFPPVEKEEVLLFHHPQVAENLLLPTGRLPMGGPAWEKDITPPTDYVSVVTYLKQPATIDIQFGEKVIAEKTFPAGLHTWLIYHPAPTSTDASYPIDSDDLAVTVLDAPFTDAEVYVAVNRDKERIGLFRSHRPIVAAAGRGEMTTIGDVFTLEP